MIQQSRRRHIDRYKQRLGCQTCGFWQNPSALCFDHRDPNTKHVATKNGCSRRTNAGGIYNLYHPRYSPKELINEIRKCDVKCSTCHMNDYHKDNPRSVAMPQKLLNKMKAMNLIHKRLICNAAIAV